MKILAIVILYSLLSGILCSCGRNKRNLSNPLNESPIVAHKTISNAGDTLIICDINRIKDTINFPLSLLLSDLEIVKLDDREDATIDNVSLHTVSPNYIGLYSFYGGIKLFDRYGNYISEISKKGQGPDEYTLSPSDMLIDEAQNRFYFTGPGMNLMMAFDLEGNPQRHIPLAQFEELPDRYNTHMGFRFDEEYKLLSVAHVPFSSEEPAFWVQDLEGHLIQWLPGKHLATRMDFSNTLGNAQNTSANDYCIGYWFDERVDSLYHYDEKGNRMKPVFTANLDCISRFHKYIELPGYYYIYMGDYGGVVYNNVYVLIDKQTLRGSYVRFKLDMLGNIGTGQWLDFTRGYYVRCTHPAILQEQWQGSDDFSELPPNMAKFMRYLQTHDVEDMNNVVLIGKLKQKQDEKFILKDMNW
jgi:hypothetical protein